MKTIAVLSACLLLLAAGILALFHDAPTPRLHPASERADAIVIEPGDSRITLLRDEQILAKFRVAPPAWADDGTCARPGVYEVRQRNPHRLYRLSLGISRDNADRSRPAFIHGTPRLPRMALKLFPDRFGSCIGVSNEAIREIWSRVMIGTEVIIR